MATEVSQVIAQRSGVVPYDTLSGSVNRVKIVAHARARALREALGRPVGPLTRVWPTAPPAPAELLSVARGQRSSRSNRFTDPEQVS